MPLITCPKCSTQFEPTDVMREEIKREANLRAAQWKREKEEDFRQKEIAFKNTLQAQKELAEKQAQHQQAQRASTLVAHSQLTEARNAVRTGVQSV